MSFFVLASLIAFAQGQRPNLRDTTVASATAGSTSGVCSANAVLNNQGVCLCPLTRKCSGSECRLGTGRDRINRITYPITYYDPSCSDCECDPAPCPSGSVFWESLGRCVCVGGNTASEKYKYQGRCDDDTARYSTNYCYRESERATITVKNETRGIYLYVDSFFPSCENCRCDACPDFTFKDRDGDCQCPLHQFCEGSPLCRESQAIARGDHLHYFDPSCETCVCNGDALKAFSERRESYVLNNFYSEIHDNTVTAKCAELCLDRHNCYGFMEKERGEGTCILLRDYGNAVGSSPDYTLYERKFNEGICDIDNGGCGDITQIKCHQRNLTTVACTQRNECLSNNGGCAKGMLCDDSVPFRSPSCYGTPDGDDDDDNVIDLVTTTTNSGITKKAVGEESQKEKKTISGGLLAGIVIGAIAFVLIIIVAVFVNSKNRAQGNRQEVPSYHNPIHDVPTNSAASDGPPASDMRVSKPQYASNNSRVTPPSYNEALYADVDNTYNRSNNADGYMDVPPHEPTYADLPTSSGSSNNNSHAIANTGYMDITPVTGASQNNYVVDNSNNTHAGYMDVSPATS